MSGSQSMGQVYDRLMATHQAIVAAVRECDTMCDRASPPDPDRLAEARWRMSKAIIEHVTFKDRYCYVPLEASDDPAVRDTAKALREGQEQLHIMFAEQMKGWSGEAIQRDWRGFRAAQIRCFKILDDRIALEERELHPLVRGLEAADAKATPRNWARVSWDIRDSIHNTGRDGQNAA